ncbi:5645_t:CDS:2, partial [Racocetra fulgida]
EVLDEDDALREHEDEASDGDTVLGRDEALGKDRISDEDVILVRLALLFTLSAIVWSTLVLFVLSGSFDSYKGVTEAAAPILFF